MPQHRKPKVWFDFEYLAGIDAEEAPREIFLLSPPAVAALTDLSQIVLWLQTRWFNGTDEEIQTLAYRIHEELNVPAHLDDLVDAINASATQYEDELTAIRAAILASRCCSDVNVFIDPLDTPGGGTIAPVGDPDDVPTTDTDPEDELTLPVTTATDPEDTGSVSTSDFRKYLCGAIGFLLDTLETWLRICASLRSASGRIADVLDWIVRLVVSRIIPGHVDDLILIGTDFPSLGELLSLMDTAIAQEFTDMADYIAANRDTLVQEMACVNSPAAAVAILQAALSSTYQTAALGALIFGGGIVPAIVALIYEGVIDAEWSEDCECAIQSDYSVEYGNGTVKQWTTWGQDSDGSDAFCAGLPNYIKHNPRSGSQDLSADIGALQVVIDDGGAPDALTYDYFIVAVEITYTCGTLYQSTGRTVSARFRLKDGTWTAEESLPASPGQHTVTIDGPAGAVYETNQSDGLQFINRDPISQPGNIDTQVCIENATVYVDEVPS